MEEAASAAFSVSRFSRKNARDETIACAVTWPTSKPECRAPRFTSQAGRKSRQVHRFSGRCPRSPHNRMALWGRKVSSNRDSAFRNQAYSRDQDAGSSLGELKSEPAMRSARRSKLAPPNTAAAFAAKEVAGLSRLVTAVKPISCGSREVALLTFLPLVRGKLVKPGPTNTEESLVRTALCFDLAGPGLLGRGNASAIEP